MAVRRVGEVWEEFRGEDLEFRELADERLVTTGTWWESAAAAVPGARPFSRSSDWISDGLLARIDAYLDREGSPGGSPLG